MEKVLQFRTRKKEKGLTLVETVVSLSVILIVSIASVSVSVYSLNAFRLSNTKRFFEHEIKNIVELYLNYYSPTDSTKFITAFEKYTGQEMSDCVDRTYYFNSRYQFIDTEEGSNFYLQLDFEDSALNASAFSNTGTKLASRSVIK